MINNQKNISDQDEILVKESTGGYKVLGSQAGSLVSSINQPEDQYSRLSNEISQKLNLRFEDEVLDRRFKNAILAGAKGIRTDLQTKDVLIKEVTVGGLGLTSQVADQIINLFRKQSTVNSRGQGAILPTQRSAAPVLPKIERSSPNDQVHIFSQSELDHEIAPPPPVVIKTKANVPSSVKIPPVSSINQLNPAPKVVDIKPVVAKPLITAAKPIVKSVTEILTAKPQAAENKMSVKKAESDRYISKEVKPFIAPQKSKIMPTKKKFLAWLRPKKVVESDQKVEPSVNQSKPPVGVSLAKGEKITDVKIPTRLIGPVDELRTLRLIDFKQLDRDPDRAIIRIREKIDLLEADSFSKRIMGIEAWKQSEVYRTYLSLGKDSMEQGVSVEAIISNRQKQGLPTLDTAEWRALVKLNKMLEY